MDGQLASGDLLQFNLLKIWTIEICDLPRINGDFPVCYVSLPEGNLCTTNCTARNGPFKISPNLFSLHPIPKKNIVSSHIPYDHPKKLHDLWHPSQKTLLLQITWTDLAFPSTVFWANNNSRSSLNGTAGTGHSARPPRGRSLPRFLPRGVAMINLAVLVDSNDPFLLTKIKKHRHLWFMGIYIYIFILGVYTGWYLRSGDGY